MKKIVLKFTFALIFIFTNISLFGQFKSLNPNDTTSYEEVKSLKEFMEFGYNYKDKEILLNVQFEEISNSYLPQIPEVKLGSSREGFSTYYDDKKIKDYVGFTIWSRDENKNFSMLHRTYGLQKEILDKLRSLKKDDQIVILGKVVKFDNGEDYGVRVKYVYTSDEFGNSDNPSTASASENDGTSFFDEYKYWIIGIVTFLAVSFFQKKE